MDDQPDHIPEGYQTLFSAFRAHFEARYDHGFHATIEEIATDQCEAIIADFGDALRGGALKALYRLPGHTDNYIVPEAIWEQESYLEPLLCDGVVRPAIGGTPWAALAGRTLFVDATSFRNWSRSLLWKTMTSPAPMDKQHWDLGEAIAWVAWRKTEQLLAYAEMGDSISGTIGALRNVQRDTGIVPNIEIDAAFEGLKTYYFNAEDSGPVARAVKVDPQGNRIGSVRIPKDDWFDLEPYEADVGLLATYTEALGLVGKTYPLYERVRFEREDILAQWGAEEATSSSRRKKWYPQKDVDDYYIELVGRWKRGEIPRLTTREWQRKGGLAETRFPGISTTQCRAVWDKHAPSPLRTPGRRTNAS